MMKRIHFFSWIVYPMFFALLRLTDEAIRLVFHWESPLSMIVIVKSFLSSLLGGCLASLFIFFPFLYLLEHIRKKIAFPGKMRAYVEEGGILMLGLIPCFLVLYVMAGAPLSVSFVIFSRPGGALILSSLMYLCVRDVCPSKKDEREMEK